MRETLQLLRHEVRARIMLAAVAQSALGTGAGYVALLLVAYERWRSPWAISLILLAEFLPTMVLGPLAGAAADRWSRRWCVVVADVVRAAAFVTVVFVGSFEITLVVALLAGTGTALFRPAMLSAIPGLVLARQGSGGHVRVRGRDRRRLHARAGAGGGSAGPGQPRGAARGQRRDLPHLGPAPGAPGLRPSPRA